jgi:hypothetical protein
LTSIEPKSKEPVLNYTGDIDPRKEGPHGILGKDALEKKRAMAGTCQHLRTYERASQGLDIMSRA